MMTMAELQEIQIEDLILAFDGRVLEVFGARHDAGSRFHVRQTKLEVGGPDKHGTYELNITGPSGALFLELDQAQLAAATPIVEAMSAAGATDK